MKVCDRCRDTNKAWRKTLIDPDTKHEIHLCAECDTSVMEFIYAKPAVTGKKQTKER